MLARIAHWQAALLEPAGAHRGSPTLAALSMFQGEEEEEDEVEEDDGGSNGAATAPPAAMEEDGATTGGETKAVDELSLDPWEHGRRDPWEHMKRASRMAVLRLPERKSFHIILHRALAFLVREAVKNPALVGGPPGGGQAGQGELERLLAHLREQPRVALGLVEVCTSCLCLRVHGGRMHAVRSCGRGRLT